jgi:biopolymer transport protein ExbB
MNMNVFKLIQAGGVTMYVIVALSVLAIAVALERTVALWSFIERARTLSDTVNRCVQRGAFAEARTACERSHSPLADVFLVGFERHGRAKPDDVDRAVDRSRQRVTLELKVRLWILGSIGAVAPFVGLFGTVVGVMRAFKLIAENHTSSFTVVAPGIAEALVTTAAGIAVAIEAVLIYNFFNQRLARVAVEIKLFMEEFLEALRAGEEKQGDGARQAAG